MLVRVLAEDRELYARRACVQDRDAVSHRTAYRIAADASDRRAATINWATAQDASLATSSSARLVRMIGTLAPSTIPAASASARNDRLFASMLPASKSGTTRMLARPATGESIFLIAAACGLIALSSASGPSTSAPVICPRSAILHKAAASSVEGTSGLTLSIALKMATRTSR